MIFSFAEAAKYFLPTVSPNNGNLQR